jgi:Arc/MetJ family transcription regulator
MKTQIVRDDALVDEAVSLTGVRTKRELIELALRELVARRKRSDLLELAGQVEFADDFDHKALRELRHGAD